MSTNDQSNRTRTQSENPITNPTEPRKHSFEELQELTPNETKSDQRARVLDIFSGAGGVGWALKDILNTPKTDGTFIGVDINDHTETYPSEFIQADAASLTLESLGLDHKVDLVWLSPPCQAYSKLSHIHYDDPKEHHQTFDELNVHKLAQSLGKEYVIENVVGCNDLNNPIKLNGVAFNRNFIFERWFETSFNVNSWIEEPTGNEKRFCNMGTKEMALEKGIPTHWSKSAIRSALPKEYIGYIISHCPTLSDITPYNITDLYREQGAGDGQTWIDEFY